MASITSNYGLSKPLGSEAPDISVINDNMDTLDSELVVKTSNDIADATATKSTGWTTVLPVAVGEKVASVFEKFSTMAKNIRWIYKFLGTADISSIGDGTVTNALTTLNTAVGKKVNTTDIVDNLTSTSTNQPLSANMGKALNDALAERDVHTPMNTVTILSNANQLTRSALATLPTGCYIVQCASTTDFAIASAYGLLFHYGSLANYHHYLFTNGEGLWKLTYSGTTQGEWQSVRPAYMDVSLTLTAVGGAVQLSSATGYVVSYNKFISGTVIDSNNINVRFHTYNNLIYAKFYTDAGSNAPTGTYKVRCWYMP